MIRAVTKSKKKVLNKYTVYRGAAHGLSISASTTQILKQGRFLFLL